MENKKYYWLKLKENFFDEKHIKFLRKLPEGDKLVIVYLKMQLKSLRTEGLIKYDKILPNNIEEIAMVLDEDVNIVSLAVQSLIKSNAIEMLDDGSLYMLAMQELIGKEGASAERVRRFRENQQTKMLQCNNDVTKCNTEIEKEIEKEKELDIEKKTKRKKFTPPTLDEVIEYCNERNNNVNPEYFIDYYMSNGWKVGKNSMKDWKATIRTWEKNNYKNNQDNKKSGNVFFDILEEEGKICRER